MEYANAPIRKRLKINYTMIGENRASVTTDLKQNSVISELSSYMFHTIEQNIILKNGVWAGKWGNYMGGGPALRIGNGRSATGWGQFRAPKNADIWLQNLAYKLRDQPETRTYKGVFAPAVTFDGKFCVDQEEKSVYSPAISEFSLTVGRVCPRMGSNPPSPLRKTPYKANSPHNTQGAARLRYSPREFSNCHL